MPVLKNAAKALRRDRRRTVVNLEIKKAYKEGVRRMRKNPTAKALQEVYSQLDRAAKKNVIRKNKASRLKSRLSKLLIKTPKTAKVTKAKKTRALPKKTPKKIRS